MVINVLGNGPSLKNYTWPKDIITIGTNWILNNKDFIKIKNYYYVVYDENFFLNKEIKWLKLLNKLKAEKVYVPNHWINSDTKFNRFQNFQNLKKDKDPILNDYFDLFWNNVENVIFKCAIPLAIHLKSNDIRLYGCDFNYRIEKNNTLNNSSYFYHRKNHLTDFTHTTESALLWSQKSNETFNYIKKYLNNFSIKLNNKSFQQ